MEPTDPTLTDEAIEEALRLWPDDDCGPSPISFTPAAMRWAFVQGFKFSIGRTSPERELYVLMSALEDVVKTLKDKRYESAEFLLELALKRQLTLNPFNPTNDEILRVFRARARKENDPGSR